MGNKKVIIHKKVKVQVVKLLQYVNISVVLSLRANAIYITFDTNNFPTSDLK